MILKGTPMFLVFIISWVAITSCTENKDYQIKNEKFKQSIKETIYNDPNAAIRLSLVHCEKSRLENNREGVAMSYAYRGVAYDVLNILDSTIYYYEKILKYSNNPKEIIQYKYSIGKIYERRDDYKGALQVYKEALNLAGKENLTNSKEIMLSTINEIDYILRDSEDLTKLFKRRYDESSGDSKNTDLKFNRKKLIIAYLKEGKTNEVFSLVEEGLVEANKSENLEFQYYLNRLKAEAYVQIENLDLAINSIDIALRKAEELRNEEFKNEASYVLAIIRGKQRRYDDQITLIKNRIDQNKIHRVEQFAKYYKLLADTYRALGDDDLHLHYRDKYDEETIKIKEKRKPLLTETRNILSHEETMKTENQKQKKWYWSIAFTLLFFVLLVVFFKNRSNEKENQELFEALMLKIKDHEKNKKDLEKALIQKGIDADTSKIESAIDAEPQKIMEEQEDSSFVIDDEKVNEILMKIEKLEGQHYFLRQDCTLHNMAKRLKTNTSYLSKIINAHFNKSFSVYVNELRINYVLIELKNNKRLRSYSVKAISEEIGYKSTDSFTKYFKQATGITPAVYIKKVSSM